MARQRLTDERWRRLVGRQARSGLTVGAFCEREGIAASTFFAKRRQLNASPRFVEVIADAAGPAQRDAHRAGEHHDRAGHEPSRLEHLERGSELRQFAGSLELRLPRGVTVRVESGFDPDLLRAVVEALA